MILTIIASQVIMSFDSYPVNAQTLLNIEILNIFLTFIFCCELGIRLISLGLKDFIKGSAINTFDCALTLISMLDVVCSWSTLDANALVNSWLITLLRATRAMRFFKLVRYWESFSLLLHNLYETLLNIKNYALLLILILYIYVLLGLAFFGNMARINPSTLALDAVNGHSPMYHFDNMMQAIFTTFTVFTNDGQSIIFYNFYRAVNPTLATTWWITFVIVT